MKLWEFLKAKSFVEQGRILLEAYRPEPQRPLLIFKIDDAINVSYNHKGWACDYLAEKKAWSCSLNPGKICVHIIAAQLLLYSQNKGQEWMQGDNFSFYEFAKTQKLQLSASLDSLEGDKNGTR